MHIALVPADPADEVAIIDPTGLYSEDKWLPVLGPTSWLLARRVTQLGQNGAADIDDDELAARIGVGGTALRRAAKRLAYVGLAEWWPEHNALTVKDRWEPVPQRLANHVPRRVNSVKVLRAGRAEQAMQRRSDGRVSRAPAVDANFSRQLDKEACGSPICPSVLALTGCCRGCIRTKR